MSAEKPISAAATKVIESALTALAPLYASTKFVVSVSPTATAEVRFTGPAGKPDIDRLIRHLEILRDSFPEETASAPTIAEFSSALRVALDDGAVA